MTRNKYFLQNMCNMHKNLLKQLA